MRVSRRLGLLGAIGGVLVLATMHGCQERTGQETGITATPAPSFGAAAGQATPQQVLAYGRALDFDTVHGLGDERRLAFYDARTGQHTFGPLARIDPEHGVIALTRDQLGAGRVVARLINDDLIPYPKLNMAPRDTVYWWIDSTATGRFQSRLVSTVTGRDTVLSVRVRTHLGFMQSLARFLWNDADDDIWVTCVVAGCCVTPGG